MQSNTLQNRTMKPLSLLKQLVPVFGIALLVAGCGTPRLASVIDGACKAFSAPKEQMYGADQQSQQFIDETTEAGIAACEWQRPAARPDPRVKEKAKQKGKKSWTGS